MKIKHKVSMAEFCIEITRKQYGIVCYGAGIAGLSTEHIFQDLNIAKYVCCFVDSNNQKTGQVLDYDDRKVTVLGIHDLLSMNLSDKVILITAEVFGSIIQNLNCYPQLEHAVCYIFAELNQSYCQGKPPVELQSTGAYKIPKVIHYAWLGGGEKSEAMNSCISSWKTFCPGYEIVEWNEENYDVYQNRYMKQSYQAKKYAFTCDYLRLDVLYNNGGIYLDTDVMALKSFDEVLRQTAFAVYLEWAVPTFGICGSIAGLPIFKYLRDTPRATMEFYNRDGSYNQKISSYYEFDALKKIGFKGNFDFQTIQGLSFYPPAYFATHSGLGYNYPISQKTFAVHLLQRTWADANRKEEIEITDGYIKAVL